MCEPVVDEDAPWQREDLSLVLETTKWCGENQAVVVALKLRPVVHTMWLSLLSEPFVGE